MRSAQQLIQMVAAFFGILSPHLLLTPHADKKFDDNTYNTKFVQRIKDMPQERLVGLLEKVSDYGIKFGSRVDIFLPLDTEINVKVGDKTKGGIQKIAQLK